MLLFTCSHCGSRIVTFEKTADSKCPNCGELASAEAGLRISIPLGMEFSEIDQEVHAPREDLVWLG